MTTPTRKFIAMHKSETGFNTPAEVKTWLKLAQPHDLANWRVVEIYVDPVTETLAEDLHRAEVAKARDDGYAAGREAEQKRMRLRLGLTVPGDSA